MSNSRSKNAKLNIVFGYLAQLGILLLSFVGRRIFLQYLSVDYLGVNGLYSNLLSVLSLAELGLDTALVYSLYKPVAENNVPLINSLLRYFKKIYIFLALGIFAIGLALIPFLSFIVKSDLSSADLITYYLLFLINSVASYFVAHKTALLSASQEQRVQKITFLISNLLLQISHIAVLIIWQSYRIYIVTTIIITFVNNIVLSCVCNKIHPYLKTKTEKIFFETKTIKSNIRSAFVYKFGAVTITNTDNILISILVSTAAVGLYSNYFIVIAAVQGFIGVISTALISGVGNLGAHSDKKRQYEIFNVSLLFYHFISALGLIGFGFLFNDVITVWLGAEYLFDTKTVFIIAVNFYITNAISPIWMYREANGLFEKVKYLMIVRSLINVLLSIILGKLLGTFGILLATAASLLVTNFWYEPNIIFKNVFGISAWHYWKKQIKYFVLTVISLAANFLLMPVFPTGNVFTVIKCITVILVTSLTFGAAVLKSAEIKSLFSILKPKNDSQHLT